MNVFKKSSSVVAVALTVIGIGVGSVQAATLSNVTGIWTGVTGGTNISGVGTNEIHWGTAATSAGNSGLLFEGVAPPDQVFNLGDIFDIGDLTHTNNPINSGTAATGADLMVSLTFSDPAGLMGTFDFTFDINETPNAPGPPDSDDIISFSNALANEEIDVDGVLYTLELTGFMAGGVQTDQFISPEGGSNLATFM